MLPATTGKDNDPPDIYRFFLPGGRENDPLISLYGRSGPGRKEHEMNTLIPIHQKEMDGHCIQTVNARELHDFLEVKTPFHKWIARRISEYDFIEDIDFVVADFCVPNSNGGPRAKEFFLSLDMAKELSMVERNAKGKEARQYFIDCEKRVIAGNTLDLADPASLRQTLLGYTEKVLEQQQVIEELTPKAEFHDTVAVAPDAISMGEAAKSYGWGRNRFCAKLRHEAWINRRNEPYQRVIEAGLMDVKIGSFQHPTHGLKQSVTPLITGKGMTKLADMLRVSQ